METTGFPSGCVLGVSLGTSLLLLFLISSLRDEMVRGPSKELGRWKPSCVREQAHGRAEHGWSRLVGDRPWLSIGAGSDGAWLARAHGTSPLACRNLALFIQHHSHIVLWVPPPPPQILIVSISHNGLKQDNLPDVLSWVFFLHGLSIPLVLTECLNQPSGIKSNEQSC